MRTLTRRIAETARLAISHFYGFQSKVNVSKMTINPIDFPYGLALHTCSPQLGMAIANMNGEFRQQTWDLGREILNQMHLLLTEFIEPQTWTDIGFLAVAKGPGSFTGTRLGVVTARTLAQQLDVPLFAVSSLAAIAWLEASQSKSDRTHCFAVQMPAQRGQLFGGIYQIESATRLVTRVSDCAIAPNDWQDLLNNWETPYELIEVPSELGHSVESILELAYLDWQQGQRPSWQEAVPFYGQHPVVLSAE